MEKKNINIGVVRTCIILLLTVFTIGRKYGQEQKATDLINGLQQQPCACCLNFENVNASAEEIDNKKQKLEEAQKKLEEAQKKLEEAQKKLEENIKEKENDNDKLRDDNNNLQNEKNQILDEKNQLLDEKNQLQNNNVQLEKEINKTKNLLEEQNSKYNELNKNIEDLRKNYTKIDNKKKSLEKQVNLVKDAYNRVNKKKDDLAEILKNTKTNVNTEEYIKFYNSISAEKKAKIALLLKEGPKNLEMKEYIFYIPFKFKDCGNCLKKKDMPSLFNHSVGNYNGDRSLKNILKSLFIRYGIEQINKEKIIDVTTLKEIYFYAKFSYINGIIIDKDKKWVTDDDNQNIIVPTDCFYPTEKNIKNDQAKFTSYCGMGRGVYYKYNKDRIRLNYSELIDLVEIDKYLEKMENLEENRDLFLLELNFKDPECIALLESVGKGNYGVVKKGLTTENGKLVTKAIKFTCYNSKFDNSKEGNIQKEILAGKIVNEIGVGNKIAFVQDYMKIDSFIKGYEYKEKEKKKIEKENIEKENIEKGIFPLDMENEYGSLENAVYTTFLNDNLQTLPNGKTNVKANFENNVFNMNGNIGSDLYIMFMYIVNGKDLFLKENKEKLDINNLGDMLFDVLNNLCINDVALKDIKPKNIIWDELKNEFSIIDVQTLGLVGRNLTDSCGTPELWPFFKTLNLNLKSKNEIEDNEIKEVDKKDNLYDRFCYSIDDNFVDIYAACMTMYFAKFNTYTAAGLLTLLLKWLVLDKENEKKKEWVEFSLEDKIKFLQNYKDNYEKYISLKNEKDKNNNKMVVFFFENIDDKNLNDVQKKELADLLKKVISSKNESNIFYLLDEIKKEIKLVNEENLKEEKEKKEEKKEEEKIITFYEECVKKDFENFANLSNWKCKYADVIKYVLCYGSCLNYNGENEEGMKVDDILPKLQLKKKIEFNDKEFFDTIRKEVNSVITDVIGKLNNGFNQTFIIELLNILPLGEYEEILKHGVSKNSVDYYFEKKMKDEPKTIKKEDIVPKTKAFYLLRYLEINKLFHIPKRLVKINSLINENTDDKLDEDIFA